MICIKSDKARPKKQAYNKTDRVRHSALGSITFTLHYKTVKKLTNCKILYQLSSWSSNATTEVATNMQPERESKSQRVRAENGAKQTENNQMSTEQGAVVRHSVNDGGGAILDHLPCPVLILMGFMPDNRFLDSTPPLAFVKTHLFVFLLSTSHDTRRICSFFHFER